MKKFLCLILALTAVFSFAACKGQADAQLLIEWDYITGLPEGFPKLCDKVTESKESFGAESNSVVIRWNILEEDSYKEYTAKIEEWAGTEFGSAKDGTKSLTVLIDDNEYTIKATYDGEADGHEKDGGSYNCQCVLEVSSAATRASKYTPISWEHLYPLPEGFPKLCDSVTTVDEIYKDGENSFAMYWNILDSESFDSYIGKIEDWADAKFGEAEGDGTRTLTATVDGKSITVKAAYNGKGTGRYLQGNSYDSQARIEVITSAE